MIKYEEKLPTVEEFNYLTNKVEWGTRKEDVVEEALRNTIYSVCVYDDDQIVGHGRLIGDKTIFLYVHDIMVIPEYQSKQIGRGIMEYIIKEINLLRQTNPDIRVYLGASKGKEGFYRKFGFISRDEANLGEGMILS